MVLWWQNAQYQKTRHDFISKMLDPLLLLFTAFSTSSSLHSNFIFTFTQVPVSVGTGRADGRGQLGWVSLCPCWLLSLRPSISVRGEHLRNPHSPSTPSEGACLRGTSVLNGAFTQYWLAPEASPLGRVGSSPSYYFPSCFSGRSLNSQQVNGWIPLSRRQQRWK